MHATPAPTMVLDVRPLLAAGREPRPAILQALESLRPGDTLQLLTPFPPQPLLALAASLGFAVSTTRADGGWSTLLQRGAAPNDAVVELDLRDLPPPEPFQRALAAAQKLGRAETLVLHTRFRPVHLLEHLATEGWLIESEEITSDHWETTLLRASAPSPS